jgi:hypothetical protein
MSAAEEFSELATKCRAWAETAETAHVRKVFLELARFWEDAGLRASNKTSKSKEQKSGAA